MKWGHTSNEELYRFWKDPNIVKKWANPGLFLFIFVLFLLQFQYKLKKHRWCAWDSNPGPQDGRRRQNHGAMAATDPKIESNWHYLYKSLREEEVLLRRCWLFGDRTETDFLKNFPDEDDVKFLRAARRASRRRSLFLDANVRRDAVSRNGGGDASAEQKITHSKNEPLFIFFWT